MSLQKVASTAKLPIKKRIRDVADPESFDFEMSGCYLKFGYDTCANALAAARRRNKRRKLGVYHCDFCGKYHIGNRRKRRKIYDRNRP